MCVIFACYKKYPSEVLLQRGAARNGDGAGVAWLDKKEGVVKWKKGIPSTVEAVKEVLEGIKNFPVLIHYRSQSVGGDSPHLTHPFPIDQKVSLALTGSAKAVLMHNGTWSDWKHTIKTFALQHRIRLPDGPWSDSRAFAFMAHHLGTSILPLLDGKDRLVVLEQDGHWTTWGDWKTAESHNEEGFKLSIDLPAPMLTQRDTKSSTNGYWNGNTYIHGPDPRDQAEYWNEHNFPKVPQASCEGGEEEEEDGEAAPPARSPGGGPRGENSRPLALANQGGVIVIPGEETKKSEPISKNSTSLATSVKDSSGTKSPVRTPPGYSSLVGLDEILGLKKGDKISSSQLEAILADIRVKNGIAPVSPSHKGH